MTANLKSALRFDNSDGDAVKTFALSLTFMAASGTLSYLLLLARVLKQALRTPCDPRNGVYLLFGKRLLRDRPDDDYRARLDRLLALPHRDAILMGGLTGGSRSEARAGRDYLSAKGYPKRLLHLEQESNNTLENLRNARRMLQEHDEPTALVISNRYHLARCNVMARSLGIPHALCAAEERFSPTPLCLVRCLLEAFYLHWFFTGKYWATLTRNRQMLEKVS